MKQVFDEDGKMKPKKPYLKPMDIKRLVGKAYEDVIRWIEKGHPRAGRLPAVDFSEKGKRRSYRIRPEDWEDFQQRLMVPAQMRAGQRPRAPAPRPKNSKGHFNY
ncbi:MAG: hypothetical protein KDA84_16625 [Planctomycetaceae bacterium]|nr:hypothetical protein [Planctomycetaceae bacterium]